MSWEHFLPPRSEVSDTTAYEYVRIGTRGAPLFVLRFGEAEFWFHDVWLPVGRLRIAEVTPRYVGHGFASVSYNGGTSWVPVPVSALITFRVPHPPKMLAAPLVGEAY